MRRIDKEDLLAQLITGDDRQATTDAVLNMVQKQDEELDSNASDD